MPAPPGVGPVLPVGLVPPGVDIDRGHPIADVDVRIVRPFDNDIVRRLETIAVIFIVGVFRFVLLLFVRVGFVVIGPFRGLGQLRVAAGENKRRNDGHQRKERKFVISGVHGAS